MDDSIKIEQDIVDTILDRPQGFSAGRRHFYLWPVTLAKIFLTQRIVAQLEINTQNLKMNPYAEALRLADTKKDDCCLLLAYHTLKTKKEVNNTTTVKARTNILKKELGNDDIATLLILCLTWDKTVAFMHHTKMDKELERMKEVSRCKKNYNTFQFGGVSIYGSIIDQACERYGWTYDYVVWEISFINLQLMLKDSIKSLYLTDEEAKKCHVPIDGRSVNGNDAELMKQVISEGNWN